MFGDLARVLRRKEIVTVRHSGNVYYVPRSVWVDPDITFTIRTLEEYRAEPDSSRKIRLVYPVLGLSAFLAIASAHYYSGHGGIRQRQPAVDNIQILQPEPIQLPTYARPVSKETPGEAGNHIAELPKELGQARAGFPRADIHSFSNPIAEPASKEDIPDLSGLESLSAGYSGLAAKLKNTAIMESVHFEYGIQLRLRKEHKSVVDRLPYQDISVRDEKRLLHIVISGFQDQKQAEEAMRTLSRNKLKESQMCICYDKDTLSDIIKNYSSSGYITPSLLHAQIFEESEWNHLTVSPTGDYGLMQIKPSTVVDDLIREGVISLSRAEYRSVIGPKGEVMLAKENRIHEKFLKPMGYDLKDPTINIILGITHLDYLLEKFRGDYGKALAAYNGGEGNIDGGRGYSEDVLARAGCQLRVHIVEKGDTLYSIGREYGISPAILADSNALKDPSLIKVGQEIALSGCIN